MTVAERREAFGAASFRIVPRLQKPAFGVGAHSRLVHSDGGWSFADCRERRCQLTATSWLGIAELANAPINSLSRRRARPLERRSSRRAARNPDAGPGRAGRWSRRRTSARLTIEVRQPTMQRKPIWLVVVSTASPWRAAGR